MKNLLIVMAILCVGMFGFAGTALAGSADFEFVCGSGNSMDGGEICLGDDLYEAKITCWNITGTPTGLGLEINEDPNVFWVTVTDDNGEIINVHGDIVAGENEVRSTDALKGPNKTPKPGKNGNNPHDNGFDEVKAEIELIEAPSCDCMVCG